MATVRERRRYLIEKLKDKDYRDFYVASDVAHRVAFQIRAMREKRGWTQSELAKRCGKSQEVISLLEDPNYGRYTTKTLLRLASAFDVVLTMGFDSYSHLVAYISQLSPDNLAVPSFEDEHFTEDTEDEWAVESTGTGTFVTHGATVPDEDDASVPVPLPEPTSILPYLSRGSRTHQPRFEYARTATA